MYSNRLLKAGRVTVKGQRTMTFGAYRIQVGLTPTKQIVVTFERQTTLGWDCRACVFLDP